MTNDVTRLAHDAMTRSAAEPRPRPSDDPMARSRDRSPSADRPIVRSPDVPSPDDPIVRSPEAWLAAVAVLGAAATALAASVLWFVLTRPVALVEAIGHVH